MHSGGAIPQGGRPHGAPGLAKNKWQIFIAQSLVVGLQLLLGLWMVVEYLIQVRDGSDVLQAG